MCVLPADCDYKKQHGRMLIVKQVSQDAVSSAIRNAASFVLSESRILYTNAKHERMTARAPDRSQSDKTIGLEEERI